MRNSILCTAILWSCCFLVFIQSFTPTPRGGAASLHEPSIFSPTKLYQQNSDNDNNEKYSTPLTQFLSNFMKPKDDEATKKLAVDGAKRRRLSKTELLSALDAGLREREWFVTGNVMTELFSKDFYFKDPDVQLEGIEEYADGVNRLFDQETSRCEVIRCYINEEPLTAPPDRLNPIDCVISVDWRLSGRVKIGPGLNIKPYVVSSDLHVRETDGLIVFQEDRFDVPGWDILLSALGLSWLPFLAKPAPPIDELIAASND